MIKTDEMILKTARDYRGLGDKIEKALEFVINADYGKYRIEKKDKPIWLILEGMTFFLGNHYNKGLRFYGDWNTRYVEIYDYEKQCKEHDEVYLNLNL